MQVIPNVRIKKKKKQKDVVTKVKWMLLVAGQLHG